MRFLFTALPGHGLYLSTLPLAWALRAAGHEVLMVNNGPAVEAIAHAGLPVVDPRPDQDLWANLMAFIRDRQSAGAPSGPPPKGAGFGSHFGVPMAEGTVRIGRAFRPDVVVSTPEQGTGALVAADLGIPLVEHNIRLAWAGSDAMAQQMRGSGTAALDPLREQFEIARELPAPSLTLDVRPPSLGGVETGTQRLMRFVPYNGERAIPEWVLSKGARPRICVTLGSVVSVMAGGDELRELVTNVATLDAEVVMVLGDVDPATLGALPDNVRTVGWMPLNALMPGCAAIVHHGGAGTALTALAYGVPQLVLPRSADQPLNAELIVKRGVGLSLDAEHVEPTRLVDALGQLLATPSFATAAGEVRREIAAQPSPAETARRWA